MQVRVESQENQSNSIRVCMFTTSNKKGGFGWFDEKLRKYAKL